MGWMRGLIVGVKQRRRLKRAGKKVVHFEQLFFLSGLRQPKIPHTLSVAMRTQTQKGCWEHIGSNYTRFASQVVFRDPKHAQASRLPRTTDCHMLKVKIIPPDWALDRAR
jgi:hypothetical protein